MLNIATRPLIALLLMTSTAAAWEAIPGPICELIHEGENALVRLTYDPTKPEYSIAVTSPQAWAGSAIFAMRFDGAAGLTITTDRHTLSDGMSTVTVFDRGFGNVLNGLEFNETATAILGSQSVSVSLDGAAPEVQKFRSCASGLSV